MTFKPLADTSKPVQNQERCPSPEIAVSNFKPTRIVYPRRLTFNELVSVRPVLHVSDYTENEKINTWYSRLEMKRFKTGVSATVAHVRNGLYHGDDDHHCIRGIEVLCFRSFAMNRKGNKLLGLKTVLDEQYRQERFQIMDPMLIRLGHLQVVGDRCAEEARQRAESDALAVTLQTHKCDAECIHLPYERPTGNISGMPVQ